MSSAEHSLKLWREASDELERKSASLRDMCRHLERRATDVRRYSMGLLEDSRLLPPSLFPEEKTFNSMWEAMGECHRAQARAFATLSERLGVEHAQLCSIADSFDKTSIELRTRAEAFISEMALSQARVAEDRARMDELVAACEQSAKNAAKKKSKGGQGETSRLTAELAEHEALYNSQLDTQRQLEVALCSTHLPQFLREFEEIIQQRSEEIKRVFVAVTSAESTCAAALNDSTGRFAFSASFMNKAEDLQEVREKIESISAASTLTPRLVSSPPATHSLPDLPPRPTAAAPKERVRERSLTGSLRGLFKGYRSSKPRRSLSVMPPELQAAGGPGQQQGGQQGQGPQIQPQQMWGTRFAVVKQLIERTVELGGHRTEGVFRISPSLADLDVAMTALDQTGEMPRTAHLAATLLKRWLATRLPEPMIPHAQYIAAIEREEKPLQVYDSIPEPNRSMLLYVVRFLQMMARPENEAVTMMGSTNLATVFAPCLMRAPVQLQAKRSDNAFVYAQKECDFLVQLMADLRAAADEPDPFAAALLAAEEGSGLADADAVRHAKSASELPSGTGTFPRMGHRRSNDVFVGRKKRGDRKDLALVSFVDSSGSGGSNESVLPLDKLPQLDQEAIDSIEQKLESLT
eukprot:m51a1_g1864 hypothetical protein (636) ;mRNA; f:639257-642110